MLELKIVGKVEFIAKTPIICFPPEEGDGMMFHILVMASQTQFLAKHHVMWELHA